MFKNHLKTLFIFGLSFGLTLSAATYYAAYAPAYAAPSQQVRVPEVQKAEDYLNALQRVKARFVMTANDGTQLSGTFYLNRPGKLRFTFDAPVKDFIVADGRFIYFYDDALGEQSNAPIGSSLADFLLREDISLADEVKVENVMRAAGLVLISLAHRDDPGAGQLILGFKEDSFDLQKWRVIDSLGNITEVTLFDVERNPTFEKGLFYYMNPNKTIGRYND